MSGVTSTIQKIGPGEAEVLLARNGHNRPLSQGRVSRFANDIKNGDWQLNGEAIKVANDGTLMDGQHRLHAIIEAGKEIETLIIEGLPREVQQTMDTGQARSLGDVLKLAGEDHYTTLSSALRSLWCFKLTGFPAPPRGTKHSPTTKQALQLLEKHPGIRESARYANQENSARSRWLNSSVIGCCHYLFSNTVATDQADVETFFSHLKTGEGLRTGDPIYALRERLVREYIEAGRVDNNMQSVFLIRAWNGWRKDEEIQRLLYKPGESAPKIDGLTLLI